MKNYSRFVATTLIGSLSAACAGERSEQEPSVRTSSETLPSSATATLIYQTKSANDLPDAPAIDASGRVVFRIGSARIVAGRGGALEELWNTENEHQYYYVDGSPTTCDGTACGIESGRPVVNDAGEVAYALTFLGQKCTYWPGRFWDCPNGFQGYEGYFYQVGDPVLSATGDLMAYPASDGIFAIDLGRNRSQWFAPGPYEVIGTRYALVRDFGPPSFAGTSPVFLGDVLRYVTRTPKALMGLGRPLLPEGYLDGADVITSNVSDIYAVGYSRQPDVAVFSGRRVGSPESQVLTFNRAEVRAHALPLPSGRSIGAPALNAFGAYAVQARLPDSRSVLVAGGASVLATGDPLFGSTVTDLAFAPDGFNNNFDVAFRASLADGRTVLGRLELPIGSVPQRPVMPVSQLSQFVFQQTTAPVARVLYFDPAIAVAYDYEVSASSPNFASVRLPLDVGDGKYDIYLWDPARSTYAKWLGAVEGGTTQTFPDGGVARFRVTGIETEANLDPADSGAFVTGLTFTTASALEFTMTPLTADALPPVATDTWLTTPEDTGLSVTLGATNTHGEPVAYEVVSAPSHGTLSGTPPILFYTPAADFNGTDGFQFTAGDNRGKSLGTVSIQVLPVNDAPLAALGALSAYTRDVFVRVTPSSLNRESQGNWIQADLSANPQGTGTLVLDGRGSSDVDGDQLEYSWTVLDASGIRVYSGSGSLNEVDLAIGSYRVSVTVSDTTLSATASATATMALVDLARVTPTSVLLNGVPAEAGVAKNGELKLSYSRQLVSRTLAPGADVLVISGSLRGKTSVSVR